MNSDPSRGKSSVATPQDDPGMKRRDLLLSGSSLLAASALLGARFATPAQAQQQLPAQTDQRPNIVFIMGDDIGWFNIGAYHQGIMASRTPNLDKLASEGMRFTDYYAEASCTAGRANFITGELPIRTGLTTVGQAGSPLGMPTQAPTIATVLKSMGYNTGQFGKNHLGDLNEFLPTLHGFDEFFGYLYHLDAMEDPAHRNYPQALLDKVGPRNMVHSWATERDDPTVQPRWGKIGKQRIEDAGTLYPKRMEMVDDEILQHTFAFIDKAKRENKPFFVWLNPTRMHVVSHLSEKYENMRNPENGWSVSEAGMAQLDDIVGAVMKKLSDEGFDNNTIVAFTTDNGAENFTWPDGGQTPFAGGKGTALEGGFRVPCIIRWPGRVPAGKVENGIISGLDWFPTFVAAAGNSNIAEELKRGKQLGDRTYKVHLDGYNQMDLITGKGRSARHEIFYFTEGTLSAVRVNDFKYRLTDQPSGWLGGTVKIDWPILTNLRLDPFERTGLPSGDEGSLAYYNYFAYQFWRFVLVQQVVAELAQTAIEFPPMQKGASFNLEAVKEQIEKAMQSHAGK
jgi:arylsulfatase A-like enzyme